MVGGVSDHSILIARLLAGPLAGPLANQGVNVHVWCPGGGSPGAPSIPGVTIHPIFRRFSLRELRRASGEMARSREPRALFFQWVPHGYHARSLNIVLCVWILMRRLLSGDDVTVMLHEAFLEVSVRNWRQGLAAMVHRVMTMILLQASSRVWVSIPRWEQRWRRYALGKRVTFRWVPVPSSVPVIKDPGSVRSILQRTGVTENGVLVGHFGIVGDQRFPIVQSVFRSILRARADAQVMFVGRNGEIAASEMRRHDPDIASRVHATGTIALQEISHVLQACDLVVQPYPDGVSSRRGSVMAALAHGVPVVTNEGVHSEPVWGKRSAVCLVSEADAELMASAALQLLSSPERRARLGRAGRELYLEEFDISRLAAAVAELTAEANAT